MENKITEHFKTKSSIVSVYFDLFYLLPLTVKYVYQIWQKEWGETVLVSNKFHEFLPELPDKLLSFL